MGSQCCKGEKNDSKNKPTSLSSTSSRLGMRGDQELIGDRYATVVENNNTVHLRLQHATRSDAGTYTLVAKNEAGEARGNVELRVDDLSDTGGSDAPAFLRRLSDLAVKVGTRTRFLVEIRSSSDIKVTWHHSDRPIVESERFKCIHEGNFFCVDVAPVMVEDGGRWTCMAENSGGRSSCSSHLNVLVPKAYKVPEFLEELRALLTEGGTVSLECKVVGVPTPVLRWYKDGKEIKAGDVFALTANQDDPTSLGTYTCEAVNCMGKTYSSSRVHVVGKGSREGSLKPADSLTPAGPPPIFTQELTSKKIKIGEPFTLSCHVGVPPWPKTIIWYNKDGRVDESERYHVMEDGLGGYMIETSAAETADEGEWKCVATNFDGSMGFSKTTVTLTYPKNYRKPRFLESLKAILTEEGLVSFECKVVGFPTPQLRWFKDGQELKPGDVYQLTGTNSLGSYSCIAKNMMGEATSSAELTVEDIQNQLSEEERLQLFSTNQPPKFFHGLKSCEAKINEDFRLTVQVSISPEPLIAWYRDDEQLENTARYHASSDNLGVRHMDITRLEITDQAEWKCVATNDFGHSVTSCFLKLSIPKHFKKPRFLECLRAIMSEEGAVNLECKVIGVPQPVLRWYKDGEELKPGDIHRIISGEDGRCCLGTYTCEAHNCMGTTGSSASLLGFEERLLVKAPDRPPLDVGHMLARNTSLSTIHEERTSQMYDPVTERSLTCDERAEVSFSFDGKEVSVSLYETPDLTEEEALQVLEMYADELSEHVSEHNVVELPPMRFTKESSNTGNLLMEAVVIDVTPDYFAPAEDDLRTDADVEDLSISEAAQHPGLPQDFEDDGVFDELDEEFLDRALTSSTPFHDAPRRPPRKKSSSRGESEAISDNSYHSLSAGASKGKTPSDHYTDGVAKSPEVDTHSRMETFASARGSSGEQHVVPEEKASETQKRKTQEEDDLSEGKKQKCSEPKLDHSTQTGLLKRISRSVESGQGESFENIARGRALAEEANSLKMDIPSSKELEKVQEESILEETEVIGSSQKVSEETVDGQNLKAEPIKIEEELTPKVTRKKMKRSTSKEAIVEGEHSPVAVRRKKKDSGSREFSTESEKAVQGMSEPEGEIPHKVPRRHKKPSDNIAIQTADESMMQIDKDDSYSEEGDGLKTRLVKPLDEEEKPEVKLRKKRGETRRSSSFEANKEEEVMLPTTLQSEIENITQTMTDREKRLSGLEYELPRLQSPELLETNDYPAPSVVEKGEPSLIDNLTQSLLNIQKGLASVEEQVHSQVDPQFAQSSLSVLESLSQPISDIQKGLALAEEKSSSEELTPGKAGRSILDSLSQPIKDFQLGLAKIEKQAAESRVDDTPLERTNYSILENVAQPVEEFHRGIELINQLAMLETGEESLADVSNISSFTSPAKEIQRALAQIGQRQPDDADESLADTPSLRSYATPPQISEGRDWQNVYAQVGQAFIKSEDASPADTSSNSPLGEAQKALSRTNQSGIWGARKESTPSIRSYATPPQELHKPLVQIGDKVIYETEPLIQMTNVPILQTVVYPVQDLQRTFAALEQQAADEARGDEPIFMRASVSIIESLSQPIEQLRRGLVIVKQHAMVGSSDEKIGTSILETINQPMEELERAIALIEQQAILEGSDDVEVTELTKFSLLNVLSQPIQKLVQGLSRVQKEYIVEEFSAFESKLPMLEKIEHSIRSVQEGIYTVTQIDVKEDQPHNEYAKKGKDLLETLLQPFLELQRGIVQLERNLVLEHETQTPFETQSFSLERIAQPLLELQTGLTHIEQFAVELSSDVKTTATAIEVLSEPLHELKKSLAMIQQQAVHGNDASNFAMLATLTQPLQELQRGLCSIVSESTEPKHHKTTVQVVQSMTQSIDDLQQEVARIEYRAISNPPQESHKASLSLLGTLSLPLHELHRGLIQAEQTLCDTPEEELAELNMTALETMTQPLHELRAGLSQIEKIVFEGVECLSDSRHMSTIEILTPMIHDLQSCIVAVQKQTVLESDSANLNSALLDSLAQPLQELQRSLSTIMEEPYLEMEAEKSQRTSDFSLIKTMADSVKDLRREIFVICETPAMETTESLPMHANALSFLNALSDPLYELQSSLSHYEQQGLETSSQMISSIGTLEAFEVITEPIQKLIKQLVNIEKIGQETDYADELGELKLETLESLIPPIQEVHRGFEHLQLLVAEKGLGKSVDISIKEELARPLEELNRRLCTIENLIISKQSAIEHKLPEVATIEKVNNAMQTLKEGLNPIELENIAQEKPECGVLLNLAHPLGKLLLSWSLVEEKIISYKSDETKSNLAMLALLVPIEDAQRSIAVVKEQILFEHGANSEVMSLLESIEQPIHELENCVDKIKLEVSPAMLTETREESGITEEVIDFGTQLIQELQKAIALTEDKSKLQPLAKVSEIASLMLVEGLSEPLIELQEKMTLIDRDNLLAVGIEQMPEENVVILQNLIEPIEKLQKGIALIEDKHYMEGSQVLKFKTEILESLSEPMEQVQQGLSLIEQQAAHESLTEALSEGPGFSVLQTLARPMVELQRGLLQIQQQVAVEQAEEKIAEQTRLNTATTLTQSTGDTQHQAQVKQSIPCEETVKDITELSGLIALKSLAQPIIELRQSLAQMEQQLALDAREEDMSEQSRLSALKTLAQPIIDLQCGLAQVEQQLALETVDDDDFNDHTRLGALQALAEPLVALQRGLAQVEQQVALEAREEDMSEHSGLSALQTLAQPLVELRHSLAQIEKQLVLEGNVEELSLESMSVLKTLAQPMHELTKSLAQIEHQASLDAREEDLSEQTGASTLGTFAQPLIDAHGLAQVQQEDVLEGREKEISELCTVEIHAQALIDSQQGIAQVEQQVVLEAREEDMSDKSGISSLQTLAQPLVDAQQGIAQVEQQMVLEAREEDMSEKSGISSLQTLAQPLVDAQQGIALVEQQVVLEAREEDISEKSGISSLQTLAQPLVDAQHGVAQVDQQVVLEARVEDMSEKSAISSLQTLAQPLVDDQRGVAQVEQQVVLEAREEDMSEKSGVSSLQTLAQPLVDAQQTTAQVEQQMVLEAREEDMSETSGLSALQTLAQPIFDAQHGIAQVEQQMVLEAREEDMSETSGISSLQTLAQPLVDAQRGVAQVEQQMVMEGREDDMSEKSGISSLQTLAETIVDAEQGTAQVEQQMVLEAREEDMSETSGLSALQTLAETIVDSQHGIAQVEQQMVMEGREEDISEKSGISSLQTLAETIVDSQHGIAQVEQQMVMEGREEDMSEKSGISSLQTLAGTIVDAQQGIAQVEQQMVLEAREEDMSEKSGISALQTLPQPIFDAQHGIAQVEQQMVLDGREEDMSEKSGISSLQTLAQPLVDAQHGIAQVEQQMVLEAREEDMSEQTSLSDLKVELIEKTQSSRGVVEVQQQVIYEPDVDTLSNETRLSDLKTLAHDVDESFRDVACAQAQELMEPEVQDFSQCSVTDLKTLATPVQEMLEQLIEVQQHYALEFSTALSEKEDISGLKLLAKPAQELHEALVRTGEIIIMENESEFLQKHNTTLLANLTGPIVEMLNGIASISQQHQMEAGGKSMSDKLDISLLKTLAQPLKELERRIALIEEQEIMEAGVESMSEDGTIVSDLPTLASNESMNIGIVEEQCPLEGDVTSLSELTDFEQIPTNVQRSQREVAVVQQQQVFEGQATSMSEFEKLDGTFAEVTQQESHKTAQVVESDILKDKSIEECVVSTESPGATSKVISSEKIKESQTEEKDVLEESDSKTKLEDGKTKEVKEKEKEELLHKRKEKDEHKRIKKDREVAERLRLEEEERIRLQDEEADQIRLELEERIRLQEEKETERIKNEEIERIKRQEEEWQKTEEIELLRLAEKENERLRCEAIEEKRLQEEEEELLRMESEARTKLELAQQELINFEKEEAERLKREEEEIKREIELEKKKRREKKIAMEEAETNNKNDEATVTERKQEEEGVKKDEAIQLEMQEKEEAEAKKKKEQDVEVESKQKEEKSAKKNKEATQLELKKKEETDAKKKEEEALELERKKKEGEDEKKKIEASSELERKLKEEADAKDKDEKAKKNKEDTLELERKQNKEAEAKKEEENMEKLKEDALELDKKLKEEEGSMKKKEALELERNLKKEQDAKEKKHVAIELERKQKEEAEAKKNKEVALDNERKKKEEEETKKNNEETLQIERKQKEEETTKKIKEDVEIKKIKEEALEIEQKQQEEAVAKKKKEELLEIQRKQEEEAEVKKKKEEAMEIERKQKEEAEVKKKKEEALEIEKKQKKKAEAKKKKEEALEIERKQKEEAEAKKKKEEALEIERKQKEEAETKKKKEEELEIEQKQKEEKESKKKKEEALEIERKQNEEAAAKKMKEEATEIERKKKEEAEAKKKKEEAKEIERKQKENEESQKKKEEALELERKRQEEEAAKNKKEEELEIGRKQKEDAEAKKKKEKELEIERKQKEEAEVKKKKEEAIEIERKQKEEAEAKKKVEEALEIKRKQKEEEEAKKKREKALDDERKQKEEEEAKKKKEEAIETERKQKAEAEAKKKKDEALEIERKLKEEEEAKKKKEEALENERKQKEEEVAKKKKEEALEIERKQKEEAEAKKKKEDALEIERKQKEEAEAKKKKEEAFEIERKQKDEEEAKKKKEEAVENERKQKEEAEAKKKKEEALENERKQKEEAEAKKKKEEALEIERKQKQEAEAKKKKEEAMEVERKQKKKAEAKKKKEEALEIEQKQKEEAEAKKKKEEALEIERKQLEEAEVKKRKEEEQEIERKQKEEEESKKKKEEALESERKQKEEAEAEKKKEEATEIERKKKEEAEAKKKKEEALESERKQKEDAEVKKKKEEATEIERKKKEEAEAKKKKEEALESERKQKEEAEAKKKKKEATEIERKKKEEAEAKKKEEEALESERKQKEEAEAKKKKEEATEIERKKKEEAEAKKKKEEALEIERKQKEEAEAKQKKEEATEIERKKKKEAEVKKKKEDALEIERKQKEELEAKKKKEEEQETERKQKEEAEAKKMKDEAELKKKKEEQQVIERKQKEEAELVEAKKKADQSAELEKKKIEKQKSSKKRQDSIESVSLTDQKKTSPKIKASTTDPSDINTDGNNEVLNAAVETPASTTILDKSALQEETKTRRPSSENTGSTLDDVRRRRRPSIDTSDSSVCESQLEGRRRRPTAAEDAATAVEDAATALESARYTGSDEQRQASSVASRRARSVDHRPWMSDSLGSDDVTMGSRMRPRSRGDDESEALGMRTRDITEHLSRDSHKKPSFCTRLTDRTAVQGSRIQLMCSVLGSPEPSVEWLHDGLPLQMRKGDTTKYRQRLEDGLAHLEVINAAVSDSGEYTCLAKNANGETSSSATLKVFSGFEPSPSPPTFTRGIKDTYHFSDDELVLECRVRSQPPPRVTWLKDNVPLRPGSRYQQSELADGVCRLVISGPEASADSGQYTCRAENAVWTDQVSHTVQFVGRESHMTSRRLERAGVTRVPRDARRPHFSSVLTDHLVPSGGTIALQVEIRGGVRPDVTWLRGAEPVTSSSSRVRTFEESGVYTLMVADARDTEAGIYTCRASNSYGYVDTSAAVEVVRAGSIRGGRPAMFMSRPDQDMRVTLGEDVTVSFRVQGDPKPRVIWMKGTRDITNSQRSLKETLDDYVRLTLKRALPSDAGTYCIMAKNVYGCDRSFVTVQIRQRARSLTPSVSMYPQETADILRDIRDDRERARIRDVPGAVGGEPVVVESGRNWLTLAWPKGEPRGGAPVLAYKVEAWKLGEEGGARWAEMGVSPINSFDAFNLKPGSEYQFRVTPRNRYGWGESVTTRTPVTVGKTVELPEFTQILPGQLKALKGSNIRLECQVRGDPVPEVRWYRDSTPLDEACPRFSCDFSGSQCRLGIDDLQDGDSGRYMCEATNKKGRVSTFARLLVVTDHKIWLADNNLKRVILEDDQGCAADGPPQFTMRLRDRRVQMTYPVRLTCQVAGRPTPLITWAKDGQEITQDDDHSFWNDDHFHTLELSHARLDHSGYYSVTARNTHGAVACRCHLVVDKGIRAYVAPDFLSELEPDVAVREGGELRLTAQVEAYPTVGVMWHRDGVRLRPSRRAVMTLDHDGGVELTVAGATLRDAGVYSCTATNEVGRAETTAKVKVKALSDKQNRLPQVLGPEIPYSKEPRWVTKPRSTDALEGDTVIIQCEVVGDPKPEVWWLRDFLKPDYYRDAPHFRRLGDGPQYRLEIPRAKLDFTGTYSVIARNEHGEAKAVISLQIYAKGQGKGDTMDHSAVTHGKVQTLPVVRRELKDLRCCDGDSVTLECSVHATPTPDVRWEKEGRLVPLGGDFQADFDGSTARLSIHQVYPEDEGEYTCVVYNELGKAATSACLVVDVPEEKETLLSQQLSRPPGLLSTASTPMSTPRTTPSRSKSPSMPRHRDRDLTPSPWGGVGGGGGGGGGGGVGRIRRLKLAAPKFYAVPHNRVAEEGETIRFQCAIAGHPTPWVTWDKDGMIVTPSARLTIKEKDDLRVLEVTQVTQEDAGLYRITVENEVGRVEASARLEVIGHRGSCARGVRAWSASPRTSPTFGRRLIGSAARVGNRLTLDCDIRGSPSPVPSWYRNGELVVRCSRVTPTWDGSTARLEVDAVTLDDAGVYCCVAENEAGVCQCRAAVVVLEEDDPTQEDSRPPSFSQDLPQDVATAEGHTIELRAHLQGAAPMEVVWSKDDVEIPDCPDFRYVSYEDGRVGLRLADVFPEDGGVYRCEAFNPFGDAVTCGRLTIKEDGDSEATPLQFTKRPTPALASPGSDATFCARLAAHTHQRVVVHWTVAGRDIEDDYRYQAEEDGDVYMLHISPVTPDDAGFVTCTATAAAAEDGVATSASCSAELSVAERDGFCARCEDRGHAQRSRPRSVTPERGDEVVTPAVLLRGPADMTVLRGDRVELRAAYAGHPTPLVRWLRAGRELASDGRLDISTGGGVSCLTLDAITADEGGKYVVSVENSWGADCHFASVAVEGPPDPPATAPSVSAHGDEAHACVVAWSSAPYDGGCIVTGYTVETREEGGEWRRIGDECHSFSHAVRGLTPGEGYVFRVRAVNVHGASEPSAESVVFTPSTGMQHEDESPAPTFSPRVVQIETGADFKQRFEILEELGKGRFGVVHKVSDRTTTHKFAAKFIRCIKAKDREKVQEEIDIMNCLRHPKLLQLAAAFENPREIVMVMELISGGELFERVVADDFTLTERDCILFMRQIVEGVEYMHSSSVVHLDLKPENIMCYTRTSHQIKLIDFGLAKKLDPATPVRVLFGTPEFIPPEIINYENIGLESDMWSVGVICYVLLSGLSPFMGDTDAETFANITRADFDFDDEAFDAISQASKDFIGSLLVEKKEKRLTAGECLKHTWLAQHDESMSCVKLCTDKLKKFIIRRKWQKTGNAIRALGRMATLSAASRRNSSATSTSPRPSLAGFARMSSVNEEDVLGLALNNSSVVCSVTNQCNNNTFAHRDSYKENGYNADSVLESALSKSNRARMCSERSDSGISDCSSISNPVPHPHMCQCPNKPLLDKKYSISEDVEYTEGKVMGDVLGSRTKTVCSLPAAKSIAKTVGLRAAQKQGDSAQKAAQKSSMKATTSSSQKKSDLPNDHSANYKKAMSFWKP